MKKCDGNYLTPEHVVKYLARYLTGGPISDRRLMSHEHGEVTFFARVGKKTGGDEKTEPIALPGVEFVRRWSLHILPKVYTKARRFGGYSNRHRQRYIAECRDLLTTVRSTIAVGTNRPALRVVRAKWSVSSFTRRVSPHAALRRNVQLRQSPRPESQPLEELR